MRTTKRHLSVIVSLLFCGTVLAQSGITLLSNWDYRRKANTYEKINKVIAATNGYLVAVGETLGETGKDLDGLFLVLKASDGSLYQWKRFGGPGNDSFNSVVQNHDGTFTLVGSTQGDARKERDGWVVRLDLQGNLLFETDPKSLDGNDDELLEVAINEQGDVLAAGMQYSNKSDAVWILEIGAWEVLGDRLLGDGSLGRINDLAAATDGRFVLVGTTPENDREHPSDVWVMKIDKNGTSAWDGARYFGDRGLQEGFGIASVQHGEGFVVIGATNSKGVAVSDMWLLKLDGNGERQWDRTYGGHAADVGVAVIERSDGGFAILGHTWSHMPRARSAALQLIFTDQRGQEQDADIYPIIGGEGNATAYSLAELLTNDNIVIAGNTHPEKAENFPTTYVGTVTYRTFEAGSSGSGDPDRYGSDLTGSLTLSPAVLIDANRNNYLESNERGYLELEISNNKNADLYNVTAQITDAGNASGLEYWKEVQVGAIPAGGKKKLYLPVTGQEQLAAGTYQLNVNLDVNGRYAASSIAAVVSNQPDPARLTVKGSEFLPASEPRPGQPVRLTLTLINSGGAPSEPVEALFRIPPGLRPAAPDMVAIPVLRPGEERQVSFSFVYDANFGRNVIDVTFETRSQRMPPIFKTFSLPSGSGPVPPPSGPTVARDQGQPGGGPSNEWMSWVSPDPIETGSRTFAINDRDVNVKLKAFTARQLEKDKFSLYINGEKYQGQKMDVVKLSRPGRGIGEYNYQHQIKLREGVNKVQIIYEDESGETFESPELVFDFTPRDKPNLYVMSIGVKHPDLEFTAKDAQDFANMYAKLRDARTKRGFKNVEVRQLTTQEETTGLNIKKAIADLEKSRIKDNDLVVVFISSHGKVNPRGEYLLMPSDFESLYEEETAVNFQEDILDKLRTVDGKILVFIDACHSGGALNGSRSFTDQAWSKVMNDLIQGTSGIEIIASCSDNEYSYEDERWGNGAFTKAILEAFRNEAVEVGGGKIRADMIYELNGQRQAGSDGVITIEELKNFIRQRVPYLVQTTKVNPPTSQNPSNKSTDLLPENMGIFMVAQEGN